MRTTLLRMLGALVCVMGACAQVLPVEDFDLDKMAGKWYIVGFATNAEWFVNNKAEMKMSTAMVVPTAGGMNLTNATQKTPSGSAVDPTPLLGRQNVTRTSPLPEFSADGTCWRMTHLANKTDTPGRYTFHSQIWNSDYDMRIVDVVYDDYALVHTIKTKGEVVEVLNQLQSRTPQVSDVLQQKFTQLSLDHGILPDNIAFLPLIGECAEPEA